MPVFCPSSNLLKRTAWERIRNDALRAALHACQVCSLTGNPLHCHELWDYDDHRGTATLVGVRMQCRNCDGAVHMGRTVKRGGAQGIYRRYRSTLQGQRHRRTGSKDAVPSAMDKWKQRGEKEWCILVAKSFLERYPELAVLEPNTNPPLF